MNAAQKEALFSLGVVAVTLATVALLIPFGGYGAMGGFGLLGLQAFGLIFYRRRGAAVAADERDRLIELQSMRIAFVVLWMGLVGEWAAAAAYFGDSAGVPVVMISAGLWLLAALFLAAKALATLVQHGWPGKGDDVPSAAL